MAPTKADNLVNIAQEGFALIEECYGKGTRRSHRTPPPPPQENQADNFYFRPQQHQQPYVYHGPQVYTVKQAVSTNETRYYGQQYVHEGPQVSTVTEPVRGSEPAHGRPYVCYGHRASPVKEAAISSTDAAQYYGGMVIMDFRKRRPVY